MKFLKLSSAESADTGEPHWVNVLRIVQFYAQDEVTYVELTHGTMRVQQSPAQVLEMLSNATYTAE